jgi:hypothetical protein
LIPGYTGFNTSLEVGKKNSEVELMQQVNDSTEPIYRKQQDNKCPDCLYLDLEFKDTPTASNNSKGNFLNRFVQRQQTELPQKKDLYLILNFNEEWLKLLGGKVKYGLRGGKLKLSLTNCKSPYPDPCLNDEMKLVTEREVETKRGVEKSGNVSRMTQTYATSLENKAKAE